MKHIKSINEGWDTTLDNAIPDLTEMTLDSLRKRVTTTTAQAVKITPYDNGREVGYHLSYKGNAVSFSEARRSDDIVVYFGKAKDFNAEGVPSEEDYKNGKHFSMDTTPFKVADFIMEKLKINSATALVPKWK